MFIIIYLDKINHKEDSISVNSIEISSMTADILPKSSSVPSLDLKSFLPTTQDDDMTTENMHKVPNSNIFLITFS